MPECEVPEALRRCKRCGKDLPVDLFLKGPRRFLCRLHIREMVKAAAPALTADERAVRKIWIATYKDVKSMRCSTSALRLVRIQPSPHHCLRGKF